MPGSRRRTAGAWASADALLRLSVGIESTEELIEDLDQALHVSARVAAPATAQGPGVARCVLLRLCALAAPHGDLKDYGHF